MQNNVTIKFDCLDYYSLAIHNNSIPIIDEIIVSNNSDFDLKNIEVEVTSTPAFFAPFIKKIGNISSERYIVLNAHDLEIDLTKVMYSVAPINSQVSVKVKNSGESIAESSKQLTLLPFDYIPPIKEYTELISAFVTPYQDEIKTIIPSVLDHLKKDYNIPINEDMWDYNSRQITEGIISSIYDAICDLRITYIPSTTDIRPTKIRLVESVLQCKTATPFELALLTASVAEYLKINTFITFVNDKVLVGFFYYQESFDTCVSDDGKCFCELKDGKNSKFVLIDTTSMAYGTSVPFSSSSITAQKVLESSEFPILVDIKRSRINGYRSIPSRIKQNGSLIFEAKQDETSVSSKTALNRIFKSPDSLFNSIKTSLDNKKYSSDYYSLLADRTVFLVGSTKQIISKLIFNEKVYLHAFPFTNNIDNDFGFLDKLVQLNFGIDKNDVSSTVNSFNDKESFAKSIDNIFFDFENQFKAITLVFGVLHFADKYVPLITSECFLQKDFSGVYVLKLKSNNITINTELNEILKSLNVSIDFSIFSNNEIELLDDFFSTISDALKNIANVSVSDVVCCSSFKFSSNRHNDYLNIDFLLNSPVFNDIFKKGKIENESSNIEYSPYQSVFTLDSSQSKAFSMAYNNKCSIIQGPNGSGKTLLSSVFAFAALNEGKKVLYYSDSKDNIDSFTNFAKIQGYDSLILKLLDDYKPEKYSPLDSVEASTISLDTIKDDLQKSINDVTKYYESLHSVRDIGFSLYEAVSQYERYRSFPYSVTFTNEAISRLSRDDVVTWFDSVSSLVKAGADCNEPHGNPLFYIREKNFSYDFKSKSAVLLNEHISITTNFINAQNNLSAFLGIEVPIMKEYQTNSLFALARLAFEKGDLVHFGVFSASDQHSLFAKIENAIIQCEEFFVLKEYIENNFTDDIIKLDCDAILSDWRTANSKFVLTKTSALSSIKNKLKAYSKNPKQITSDNFVDIVSKISEYKNSIALIEENAECVFEITGIDICALIDDGNKDVFSIVKEKINVSREYLDLISEIYDGEQHPKTVFYHSSVLFKNTEKLEKELEPMFYQFQNLYNEYKISEDSLSNLLNLDLSLAKEHNSKLWYYFIVQFYEKILDNIDLLKYWCNWNSEKEKALNLGLGGVVKLYETEQISSNDVKNAFLKGFFKSVSEYFLTTDKNFNDFSSEKQSRDINNIFALKAEYDNLLKQNLFKQTYESINNHIQSSLNISVDEGFDLLNNSSSTSKEFVSILQEIKPCFVVSNVNFLKDFSLLEFDYLIIDSDYSDSPFEMMTLFPLAKRVILTESQPTDFCDILREFGAVSYKLNWLYNTNYTQSLVNELFYNNTLSLTSSMTLDKVGINVIHQLGNYDCRKSRVNIIEASAVVDEIVKCVGEDSSKSIGVYTMTDEQRKLIELLLQKRFGTQVNEFFEKVSITIKDFEYAEYSPKDVIIFSTVISEEERSKYKQSITKTIPELSKNDSIKRLINILTSAKTDFLLITSLSQESLENFKTTEKNYCIFKKTLERFFDDSKTKIQEISCSASLENSIIKQVSNHIESLGYKVDLNVGCNNAKIDIAVRLKETSNYLLGIVFDETAYINGEDFFSRNLIQSNFERLGNWKIHRIFTVEWFESPMKQLDIITSILKEEKNDSGFLI